MLDIFIPMLIFTIFIVGSIFYYVRFWHKNKLWMVFIAINSQIVATNSMGGIIHNNFKQLYSWLTKILGLGLVVIMYYRYWKVYKKGLEK